MDHCFAVQRDSCSECVIALKQLMNMTAPMLYKTITMHLSALPLQGRAIKLHQLERQGKRE